MKKKKLSLDKLQVKSFVTDDLKFIKGGEELMETLPEQIICAPVETAVACHTFTCNLKSVNIYDCL